MNLDLSNLPPLPGIWYWIAALLVSVLGAGRLDRLVTADDFPPMVRIREWWIRLMLRKDGSISSWSKLVTCHWCFAPYAYALALGTAWLTHLHWGWWLAWGWLAGSYLVSLIVERDEKD